MTKYIRINNSLDCDHYDMLNSEGSLLFIENRSLTFEKVYDYIIYDNSKTNIHLINILLNDNELLESYLDSQGYENKEELLNSKFIENTSILKHIEETVSRKLLIELIHNFCEKYEFNIDTFGYSPWAYGIYSKNLQSSYVNDVYHDYNFYDIQVLETDEDGSLEVIDSICEFYLVSDEDLKNAIVQSFDIKEEDIIIIDDYEGSQNFNTFNKIKTNKILKEYIAWLHYQSLNT